MRITFLYMNAPAGCIASDTGTAKQRTGNFQFRFIRQPTARNKFQFIVFAITLSSNCCGPHTTAKRQKLLHSIAQFPLNVHPFGGFPIHIPVNFFDRMARGFVTVPRFL